MNTPVRAKKSLGQNFLKSKKALRDIVNSANIEPDDTVLEVGPGKGILTEALLEKVMGRSGKILAVEKDERLIGPLREKFASAIGLGKLQLVTADILNINLREFGLIAGKYKIAANIPYYITGQFLRIFLSGDIQPSKMVLLLQKEVAKRIVARDEKESILSISVKVFGKPKYIDTVEAKYFSPEPNVDSAILLIDSISKDFFIDNSIDENGFFAFLKKGFAHKRKILAQNLEIPTEKRALLFGALSKKNQNEKARAENLSPEDWKVLFLESQKK